MSCDFRTAERQITRLAAFAGYSQMKAAGIAELTDTLAHAAANEDHAERIIDQWLRENRFLPAPVDLRRIAEEQPEHLEKRKFNRCDVCQGTAWEPCYHLSTYARSPSAEILKCERVEIDAETYKLLIHKVDEHTQRVDPAVKPCLCDYGQALRRARIAKVIEKEQEAHK